MDEPANEQPTTAPHLRSLAATLIIDMQVGFFQPHTRLTNNRPALTAQINELAACSRRSGVPVFWVSTVYSSGLEDAPLNVKKAGQSKVIEGSEGAQLLSELAIAPTDVHIVKKRYSAFFGTDLDEELRRLRARRVVLAGVNTHACIRTSAIDAFQRDYEVVLAKDCIDSYDERHHFISMAYMDGRIAVAMTNDQIAAELTKWGSTFELSPPS